LQTNNNNKKQANNQNNNSHDNSRNANRSAASDINKNGDYTNNEKEKNNDNDDDNNNDKSRAFRILIVDDDADITVGFKEGLEGEGFKIDVFNDPLETLSNFKEKEEAEDEKNNNTDNISSTSSSFYDLVLLDVRMPKMNGFELYHEMKKINDKVKVCFITAYEVYYEQLKEEFPAIDIGCFIKKPIQISELVRRIKIELGLL
jgi:two-component system, OmpR family, response regulator ChvI